MGEVSAAAEAFGVVRGMRLGEAMSRCPALRLVPPDPEGVRSLWHAVLDRLEGIGAQVESDRAGAAFFESAGLHGLHGGDLAGVLAAARRALGPGARLRRRAEPLRRPRGRAPGQAAPRPPRPRGRGGRPCSASSRRCPSRCCAPGPSCRRCPRSSSGSASARSARSPRCPRARWPSGSAIPGLLALDLARGRDSPLEPRRPPEPVSERLDLPEAASGQQLERALELLVARVLARRERRGRSLRALAVSARFVAGGTWRTAVTLRNASADPERILLALGPKLAELPAPAESLALEVEAFGPPAQDQGRLLDEAAAVRRAPPGRGRPPGAPGGGHRRRAAGARGRPGLAHPGAALGARAVPGRPGAVNPADARRLGAPEPAAVAADDAASRMPWAGRRSTRCARTGSSRTAGGPGRPLRRRYFELVLDNGRNVVVFRDLVGGGWFMQRA